MHKIITIHFAVSMNPTELPAVNAWASGFTMTKELSGDLVGTSEGLFINAGRAEGMRSYVVVEKLTGTTTTGEPAGVILEHGGIENDESAWFGRIVPGTGTGAWEGLAGSIRFDSDEAGEMMVLTLA